jgi:phytoene dehydrogenase-like protein
LQALSHLDVEVRTGAEVAAISPGAPHRVRLVDGGEVAGRAIVCAVDGTRVARWLGDALPPSERARAAAMPASLSANGVFLGVDLDLRALGFTDANRWRYEHDDLDAVFAPVLAGDEPEHLALYFASSSLKDPDNACAPAGCQSLTVLAWAPASRGPGDAPVSAADDDARRASRVFDAAMSAFPALRDHVVFREDFAPSDLWRHARARQGGFYGPEMSPAHSFPRRFSPRTGVPGIFQAGASVFGCGVVPSLLSGRIAGGLARASTWRPGRALLP